MARKPLIIANPQVEIVTAIQDQVRAWVAAGYPDVSPLTLTLLRHWFGDPHLMRDGTLFQWYSHQRRAVETTIYLLEVREARRVEDYARVARTERTAQRDQWAKIGLQLATGAGKTKVLSLLMTWAHLHWMMDDSDALGLGGVQLLIAPNLIVLERLLTDFQNGSIFQNDPLIPPELRRDWHLRVHTASDIPAEWEPGQGYLIVTNIQKLLPLTAQVELVDDDLPPQLAMFETPTPVALDVGAPRIVDFLRSVTSPIAVYNDEAHHVHDEYTHYPRQEQARPDEETKAAVAWHGVLSALNEQSRLALQTDVSATLYEERTQEWFRHAVFNYGLAEAIADGVVKKPYLARIELQYKDGHDEPIPLIDESATNAWDKYTQLIQAGIAEWKKEQHALDEAGLQRKAIMFIVCNDKKDAGQIALKLEEFIDPTTGEALFAGHVREIHIGRKEQTNDKEWERIRDEVRRVDEYDNPYTAVVSVMMLKEGWDVRNVKVIVPLRPCDSRTLTEQILGRGLRRMFPPEWTPEGELRDRGFHEGLYVIRHPSFEKIINQIQDIVEEVDERGQRHDPARLVINPVEPAEERQRRDLPIPQITGAYETSDDWVEKINRHNLPPLSQRHPWVESTHGIEGILRHIGLGGERMHDDLHYDVRTIDYASIDQVIASYAESIRNELHISRYYEAAIKGLVKAFLERGVYKLPAGIAMNLDDAVILDEDQRKIVLANIQSQHVKEQVVKHVAAIIATARTGQANPEIQYTLRQAADLRAFEAVPRIIMQRPDKSVFDACCFDVEDEKRLAENLDMADDVAAWLWNDQNGVSFRMQYAFEGRTPYYYPDFLVRTTQNEMWVVETKGSVRERDRAKEARAERYVEQLTSATGTTWRYLFLINDPALKRGDIAWWSNQGRCRFGDLVKHIESLPVIEQGTL